MCECASLLQLEGHCMALESSACQTCAKLPPGLLCGLCAEKKYGREVKARATKRRPGRTISDGRPASQSVIWLTCRENHTWSTEVDTETRAVASQRSFVQSTCPTCGRYYANNRTVVAVLSESTKCTRPCWKARYEKCVCSCRGARHGIERVSGRGRI